MVNIDKYIGISLGLGITLISISGIRCINSSKKNCSKLNIQDTQNIDCLIKNNNLNKKNNCSKVNMNLGLGSLCVCGLLTVYKHILN